MLTVEVLGRKSGSPLMEATPPTSPSVRSTGTPMSSIPAILANDEGVEEEEIVEESGGVVPYVDNNNNNISIKSLLS